MHSSRYVLISFFILCILSLPYRMHSFLHPIYLYFSSLSYAFLPFSYVFLFFILCVLLAVVCIPFLLLFYAFFPFLVVCIPSFIPYILFVIILCILTIVVRIPVLYPTHSSRYRMHSFPSLSQAFFPSLVVRMFSFILYILFFIFLCILAIIVRIPALYSMHYSRYRMNSFAFYPIRCYRH